MTKIKLCGLTRQQDIQTVNEMMPDYIGFVFAKSRRQVDEFTASALKSQLSPTIKAVGVFVNQDLKFITSLCQQNIIDMIQLHGDEDRAYIQELKKTTANSIIKAVRVQNTQQILQAQNFPCDYLLLDTYLPDQFGGGGKSFDWTMIPKNMKPYFLAGGLSIDNISTAVAQCSPYCVDMSSGIETNGHKDPKKMIQVINKLRSVATCLKEDSAYMAGNIFPKR